MDFAPDDRTRELTERARAFLDEHVLPAEPVLEEQLAASPNDWGIQPVVRDLQSKARKQGLWNLFLPGAHGAGLTNLQYAPVAEVTGWSPRLAPAAFNCAAPDTGNMEVLNDFGTAEQKHQWLDPLLRADIRSSFCMTEPDIASSDATNIGTRIRRDGDHYVVSGRKWWSTGAMNPDAAIFIVM
jgi:acyl-CoA dehydrogenase